MHTGGDCLALLGGAAGVSGGALELRSLDQCEGRLAGVVLGDLEHGAAELAGLGLWLLGLLLALLGGKRGVLGAADPSRVERQRAVQRVDDRAVGDLAELGYREELAVDLDQHSPVAEPVNDLPSDGGRRRRLRGRERYVRPDVLPALLVATTRT